MSQPSRQLRPSVRNEREEKPRAAGCAKLACGAQQILKLQSVLLEIDAAKAIYLWVK